MEGGSCAALCYGVRAWLEDEYEREQIDKPDFELRGTTLWLGGEVVEGRIAPYHSGFDATRLPWFFDRAFMTQPS